MRHFRPVMPDYVPVREVVGALTFIVEERIMEEKKQRIEELVARLNRASESYYGDRDEIMSNYEWDLLFDELHQLEEETGYILSDSPTQTTGILENTQGSRREAHEYPALSLAKTKNVEDLMKWAGTRPVWISWKLDGITLVATYDKGKLTKLMTRGNGTIGTNITFLAGAITWLPDRIADKGHLVVRGEAVMSYSDFNAVNELVPEDEDPYANPRNLVAGTLNLDPERMDEVKRRGVHFIAFTLVYCSSPLRSWGDRMDYLNSLGFHSVDHEAADAGGIGEVIRRWTQTVRSGGFDYPVDGLVVTYDDTDYAAAGTVTGHHQLSAGMAFKWQDVSAMTTLDHIEWSCAASTISPVAVFDPVSLEGTTVRRASLCNLSEMERLGIGADRETSLKIIKANMIIPKCIEADSHGTEFVIPSFCPVCGASTEIRTSEKTGTRTLHCVNPDCTAKQIQKFTRFVSKTGMDIDGMSTQTIIKWINEGFLKDFADIYHIRDHQPEILKMEGFGEKSFANIIRSIEKSRKADPVHFIYALCIPMIGSDAGKRIIGTMGTKGFLKALEEEEGFDHIDGIGPEKSGSILKWYQQKDNRELLRKLLEEIQVEMMEPVQETKGTCKGLTFVITGDVHRFKNRSDFKAYVESQGGKVTGSVSGKTDFLVNNEAGSASAKNRKAVELKIPVLTEEEFIQRFGISEEG